MPGSDPKRKRLEPKGADEAALATTIMRTRLGREDESEEPEQAAEPEAAAPAAQAASSPAPRKAAKRRQEPEGITRKTLYLTDDDAERLEAALDQIAAKLKFVPKYKIMTAILEPGLGDVDGITRRLREQAIAELGE